MSTDVLALPLPDAASTRALGHVLGTGLFEGAVILLHGPLGAGKTCLVGGLAAAVGVVGPVQSPTYILVAEYPEARVPLRHADLYRLDDPREVDALHLDERVGRDGAWCVEWAERAEAGTWPADRLELRLTVEGEGRTAALEATGPRHALWLAHVREVWGDTGGSS
jgi:tRNA threonylcarbamoyladenosine biosynthesis protein TsaE